MYAVDSGAFRSRFKFVPVVVDYPKQIARVPKVAPLLKKKQWVPTGLVSHRDLGIVHEEYLLGDLVLRQHVLALFEVLVGQSRHNLRHEVPVGLEGELGVKEEHLEPLLEIIEQVLVHQVLF